MPTKTVKPNSFSPRMVAALESDGFGMVRDAAGDAFAAMRTVGTLTIRIGLINDGSGKWYLETYNWDFYNYRITHPRRAAVFAAYGRPMDVRAFAVSGILSADISGILPSGEFRAMS
jgi:hypothetical protein